MCNKVELSSYGPAAARLLVDNYESCLSPNHFYAQLLGSILVLSQGMCVINYAYDGLLFTSHNLCEECVVTSTITEVTSQPNGSIG